MDHEKITDEITRRMIPFWEYEIPHELLGRINGAKLVFVADTSHGTHEYYVWRARLSQKLIEEFGFNFVAVEGEWPASQYVTKYLGAGQGATAASVLGKHFRHWPEWLWVNHETAGAVEALRQIYLQALPRREIGFHGLDLYSLGESVRAVPRLLAFYDEKLAGWAEQHYRVFEPFSDPDERYPRSLYSTEEVNPAARYAAGARAVYDRLTELPVNEVLRNPLLFDALQNAAVVVNAEHYYRAMVEGGDTWRIRDHHMAQMLQNLLAKYSEANLRDAKGIVWCHSNHAGNYLRTALAATDYVNLGGLMRKLLGDENVVTIGMGTYEGAVTAARAWGSPPQAESVPPARTDSIEHLCHLSAYAKTVESFALVFDEEARRGPLGSPVHHRYFTVTFDPAKSADGEMISVPLAGWYDAFIFFDHSRSLDLLPEAVVKQEAGPGRSPEPGPI